MIAGIPFVLAGQLKTNTPHYIHFSNPTRFYVMSDRISSNPIPNTTSKRVRLEKLNINEDI